MATVGESKAIEDNTVDVSMARHGDEIELRRVECRLTDSLWKRMLRMIFPEQRKQERLPAPPLVGYLGTACASRQFDVADISLTGFCLLTDERWVPGTEMPITLQRTNLPGEDGRDSFTVQATVVRCDEDGVGFSIVLSEEESNAAHGNPLRVQWMTRAEMEGFLQRLKSASGSKHWDGLSQSPLKPAASPQAGRQSQLKTVFENSR
jgi:hypothetical protein